MERFTALVLIILLTPIWVILYLTVRLTSKGPFLFKQKRVGKNHKIFTIFKIRTMFEGSEVIQKKYLQLNMQLNMAAPQVFKIYDDPRFTKIGKMLSHSALDELPQLINIVKGEMSFVGPRPLPPGESAKIPKKYKLRFSVLPGITSSWVVSGAHSLSFDKWMKLDIDCIKNKSVLFDLYILVKTLYLILRMIISFII